MVVTATQEAEVGGSWSKADPSQSPIPYLKNKLKAKGLRAWCKWQSTCLASTRLWLHPLQFLNPQYWKTTKTTAFIAWKEERAKDLEEKCCGFKFKFYYWWLVSHQLFVLSEFSLSICPSIHPSIHPLSMKHSLLTKHLIYKTHMGISPLLSK
jgi:hypothetical protein